MSCSNNGRIARRNGDIFTAVPAVVLVAVVLSAGSAMAAEPSAADLHPPGVTIGTPGGGAPPEGLFLHVTTSYYDAETVDRNGNANGTHLKTSSLTPTLIWSTGWEFLGGRHFMIANLPIVNADVRGPQQSSDNTGLFNFYFSPIGLSWTLAPGIFVSAGSGVYLPTTTGGVGNNFQTFEQQLGFGYLRDGWNLSVNAFYDINSTHKRTQYATGNRFYADFTATKKFGEWEIGPVGYVVEQTTDDSNSGMSYGPFKPTFGKVHRVAVGGLVGYDFGPLTLKGYVTSEIYARNGASGVRGWIGFDIPLWMSHTPGKIESGL
jgi:hypothetical protein